MTSPTFAEAGTSKQTLLMPSFLRNTVANEKVQSEKKSYDGNIRADGRKIKILPRTKRQLNETFFLKK